MLGIRENTRMTVTVRDALFRVYPPLGFILHTDISLKDGEARLLFLIIF